MVVLGMVVLGASAGTSTRADAADAVGRTDRLSGDAFSPGRSGSGPIHFDVVVGSQRVDEGGAPLELHPEGDVKVTLTVHNDSVAPITVRWVQFSGGVLNLSLFASSTRIPCTVPAGGSSPLVFPLDVPDLGSQATGLVAGELRLVGADHAVLASRSFPVRVRGTLWSSYGLFGGFVALVTVLLLASVLIQLVRGTLPEERWSRALRCGVPGLGVGLTITLSLSAFGLLAPRPTSGVLFVVGCALTGAAVGFLTPAAGPDEPVHVVLPVDAPAPGSGVAGSAGS
jgi:hypothetical protein